MSLAILFHFLCAQHVSDINISIVRSLRLFCWIITLVVFCSWFDVCWSFGVVGLEWCPCCRLKTQPATRIPFQPNRSCASACNTDTTPTQPHRNSNTLYPCCKLKHHSNPTTPKLQHMVSVLQAEAQLVLQPATRIPLQPNHTESPTHIEPRTIWPMW